MGNAGSSAKAAGRAKKGSGRAVSLREAAGKAISTIRKPFGGRGGRKSKSDAEREAAVEEARRRAEAEERAAEQRDFPSQDIPSAIGNFFCTGDDFIDKFDDKDMLAYVRRRFPGYEPNGDESRQRRAILDMLRDAAFMQEMMDRFGVTIFEVFRFFFRQDQSPFQGAFLAKVQ